MAKKKSVKTIGVLTSGGDAPGMNAAVRARIQSRPFVPSTVTLRVRFAMRT